MAQAESYASLAQSGCTTVAGFKDVDEYHLMREALSQMGLDETEQADARAALGAESHTVHTFPSVHC